jgi:phosphoribosylcarboxyaminoimidazole (NCAIR) mutase
METVFAALVQGLIALAPHIPGALARLFGTRTDEEAKAHALAVLGSLRVMDVEGIVDAHRKPPE